MSLIPRNCAAWPQEGELGNLGDHRGKKGVLGGSGWAAWEGGFKRLEDGVIERKSVLGSRNSLCKEKRMFGKSEDWKEGQSHLTGVRTRTIAREICEIIERLMK